MGVSLVARLLRKTCSSVCPSPRKTKKHLIIIVVDQSLSLAGLEEEGSIIIERPPGKCVLNVLETEAISLWITSWLSSFATSSLRATARDSARLVRRHLPVATNDVMYFEGEGPDVPDLRMDEGMNPYSPLRAWSLPLTSARRLLTCRELGLRLFRDRDFVLAVVAKDGRALSDVDESLKGDRDVVSTAVAQNGWVLEIADKTFQDDRSVVEAAVTQNGLALKYAHDRLKGDRNVVSKAVAQDGGALQYAHSSLRGDQSVVLSAVKQNGRLLEFADESLKQDRDVVLVAVAQNGNALQYVHGSLRNDPDIQARCSRRAYR